MNNTDEAVFRQVEASAVAGVRCPMRDMMPDSGKALARMAHAGRLRIQIYRHNFRVVTILEGPHTGRHTRLPARGRWKPSVTIGPEIAA